MTLDRLEILKDKIREILPSVRFVIGYTRGFDSLHPKPYFVSEEEDIDRLIWDEFCIHNLATYLPPQKWGAVGPIGSDEKMGVVVKGCDSRSVMELLKEGVVSRENLVILGIPCQGKVDLRKLKRHVDIERALSVNITDTQIKIVTSDTENSVELVEVLYDKCLACQYPNPLVYDRLIGDEVTKRESAHAPYSAIEDIEKMSVSERLEYWEREMSRCIRCYACRNVCPTCYCMHQCIAQTRMPKWMSQETGTMEKKFFQILRAVHNAGRCTDCGECQRVCPMGIPINLINKKLGKEVLELFGYTTGINIEERPPLMTFREVEDKIVD